jgi:hypothetical protein
VKRQFDENVESKRVELRDVGIAIGTVGLAVLALIILWRCRCPDSPSAQPPKESSSAVTCDDEGSGFVSGCGGGSSDDFWESPVLNDE